MTRLAYKKINAFSGVGHGFYFWNFRTDIYEPSWSYMAALDRGWIPKGNLNDPKIANACRKEDNGEFNCITKTGQLEKTVRSGMKYCLNQEKKDETYVDDLNGEELVKEADKIFNEFWKEHHTMGATCDFGGVATLVELNRTTTDEDSQTFIDADAYTEIVYVSTTNIWVIIGTALVAAIVGSAIGFIVAMRTNKKFNRKVRQSRVFASFSNNPVLRKSLAFDKFDYDDLGDIPEDEEPLKGEYEID